LTNTKTLEELKQQAFKHCTDFVKNRIARIQSQIKELQLALTSETKSSAGDKHETGRAMLQLEREKLGEQLAKAEQMQLLLHKAAAVPESEHIGLGTLVITDKQAYYIAISAGELVHKGVSVFCISPLTPIAKLLAGKKRGDTITFNQTVATISNSR